MARKDLLSEAIADAKAVKETAMANAKLALEEAFTPKLQSMISAKLAEEAEEEEDETEEAYHSEEAEVEEYKEAEMDSEEEMEEAEMDSEEEEMEMEEEEEMEMDSEEDEDELDLESIIRELEDENEMDSEEEVEMTEEEEMEMDSEEEVEMTEEAEEEEEEIDLDEVIRTLKEMEDGDEEEEAMTEAEEEDEDMAGELEEAYTTIKSLQTTINEVNLLNAKLLYTNKLFRTFDLNENQKVKVLENFDRTSSVREVKLVFSTLAENLNVAKKTKVVVREGYASKATKSSAPKKKIISEGNELAARWKKLAGLI